MKDLHEFKIEASVEGGRLSGRVEIDGMEVLGVRSAKVVIGVDEVPRVVLEVIPKTVTVSGLGNLEGKDDQLVEVTALGDEFRKFEYAEVDG